MTENLLIRGGMVARSDGMERVDVLCSGGRIAAIGANIEAPNATEVDATGCVVGPGFIDVHVHGGGGFSFFRPDLTAINNYAEWAPRNGLTSFLVSTVGNDSETTTALFAALTLSIRPGVGAEPLGFHMEGPFINPVRKGAFDPRMLRHPDPAEFLRHQAAANGLIRQVTLAPELPGALDLIREVAQSGAIPAMGHTDATVEEARAGFRAGARHVTHLYNAMRPLHHREGGPSVAALLESAVTCEVISDGAHVDPDVLRMAYSILGPNRAVVVTDNLNIAGTEASTGRFAGMDVSVSGAKAVRSDGTIVGSVATIDQHFRNVVEWLHLDLPSAFKLCSLNPARVAGATNRKGSLDAGKDADLVILDVNLNVRTTICRGEITFANQALAGP